MSYCTTIDITIADYYGFTYVYKRLCLGYFIKNIVPNTLLYRSEGDFEIDDKWIHNEIITQSVFKLMKEIDAAKGFTPEIPKEKETLLKSIKFNY